MAQKLQQWPSATLVPTDHDWSRETSLTGSKGTWKQQLAVGVLILSDVLLALAIWVGAGMVQGFWGRGPLSDVAEAAILPNVAIWIGLRVLLGFYPGYGLDQVEELRKHTYAVLSTVASIAVFAMVFQVGDSLSRMQLVIGFVGLLLLAPLVRHLAKLVTRRVGLWGKPIMVLGHGTAGARITSLLQGKWELGYDPVSVFDYRPGRGEGPFETLPEAEVLAGVAREARKRRINTIVFAMPNTRREQLAELVGWAKVHFRHVVIIPNLSGVTNSAVVARDLAGTLAVEIKYNLLNPWALRVKQAFDLVATVLGGVLVLPFILALMLLVRLESGGSVFYKDTRLGRDGKKFSCWKFRTMVPGAEDILQKVLEENPEARAEYLKYHKLRDDPRVTRVGRFLRKTSIDELPQLWNVLRGEMSLVGPRPYLPRESEEIGTTQLEILRVRPGITGIWQVDGRSNTSFVERVRMDAYYVHDWSVWLDIVILIRTAKTVAFGRGAY